MKISNIFFIGLVLATFCSISCKSLIGVQTATNLGATGGEAFGEVFGKASGNETAGAVIGASLGEVTGSVIGLKMDKQASDIKKGVTRAKVHRVGNNIVVEFNSSILFKSNRSDLSLSAKNNLDELVNVFKKYPDTYLEINGHTDSTGGDSLNQSLSQKRAVAVADYLKENGVDNKRISTKGLGNTFPKYDNSSEKGRRQNRRVEILVSAK